MVSSLSRHVLLEGPEEINSEIEVKGILPPTDKDFQDFGKYLCGFFYFIIIICFFYESALPHLKKPDHRNIIFLYAIKNLRIFVFWKNIDEVQCMSSLQT